MQRRWWARWGPLLGLVVAGAVRWVVADSRPEVGSTVASEALGCAWAAALVYLLPERGTRGIAGSAWRAALAGAMLLGGPLLALLVQTPVSGSGLTTALALTPVVVAVASAAMGLGAGEDVPGRLWPGLAAVAGLLLVLATPSLNDAPADAVMALAPVLAGVGVVWFCVQSGGIGWRIRWALTGGAGVFAASAAVQWVLHERPVVSAAAVAWDGVLAGLGMAVLGRLGATRWSAQFTLLPLLVLLAGIVLMRPVLGWRDALGLLLLASAGGYLLWDEGSEESVEDKV
jgi:drug/metabolite transporter (DMT)-like permease